MGAEPYWYFTKYQPDVDAALQELRHREFETGRYNPVVMFPYKLFPLVPGSPAPGPQHASIEEAREMAAEDGTRSILDLDHVSDCPDYCAVAPLSDNMLQSLYGTTQPTHDMVEKHTEVFEDIERGQGIYVIVHEGCKPSEIFFAGYSFD